MTCQYARELFSAAVDDALSAGERERLDAHLAGCADCRREWARFEQTVSLLRGAEPIRAPAGFVDRVLEAVRPEPWWRRLVAPSAWRLPLQAAAVAVVTIAAVLLYRGMPEQRQAVQTGAPFEERPARPQSPAPGPEATPPRTAESRDAVVTSGSKSGQEASSPSDRPVPPAPEQSPAGPTTSTPAAAPSTTEPRSAIPTTA